MINSNTITFFNAENKTINDIINASNNDLYIINDNEKYFLVHKKSGSAILLPNKIENEVGDTPFNYLSVHIYEDIRILRYLFKYYNILFFDDAFESQVEFLDKIKDKKYWENERNLYSIELMMHYGVIRDIPEFEKTLNIKYKIFVDETLLEKTQLIQYKRLKTLLFKTKIKLFFKRIKLLFKRTKKIDR